MKINGHKCKFKDCGDWFSNKGDVGTYIVNAANAAERGYRLKWLSEGSLQYHMTQFKSVMPHGGSLEEKALFTAFINSLSK